MGWVWGPAGFWNEPQALDPTRQVLLQAAPHPAASLAVRDAVSTNTQNRMHPDTQLVMDPSIRPPSPRNSHGPPEVPRPLVIRW